MRNTLLIAAAMLPLAGGLAPAASANDAKYANLALQELHNLAVASVQAKDATNAKDEDSCKSADERAHAAAHKAIDQMNSMSPPPFDAITDASNFLRINNGIHDGWNPCVQDSLLGSNFLPNLTKHAIAALRYDYSIGDADWYTINANGEIEAKNPQRYARSLVLQGYHFVKIRPKGKTATMAWIPDWEAEMASQAVDDFSIQNSGTNLKAVEVYFRERLVDDDTKNTSVFFYRHKEDALAAKQ